MFRIISLKHENQLNWSYKATSWHQPLATMSHRAHKCLQRCLSSRGRDEGLLCPSPLRSSCSTCRAWIHREEKKKKSKNLNGKKQGQQATGCTWPWEGWLVGSRKWRERRRGRRNFASQLCSDWKKKILFWSTDKRFVALSAGRKEVEGQLATAGVKCSCGGDSN